jgi:hypothetical protein
MGKLTNQDAQSAYCSRCKCTVHFRIGQNKVTEHLERYHEDELKKFIAQQKLRSHGRAGNDTTLVERSLEWAFDDVADQSTKRKARELTTEEKKRLNRLLAMWIARHFRPMLIVEDAGFIAFVRYISIELGHVNVVLPMRTRLRLEVVALATDLRSRVKSEIQRDFGYYSITSDIWTARNTRSYIACTLHYVDDKFVPRNWTLEVQELPGIHYGDAIAAALEKIMQDWSLSKDRCTKVVRDAGSNMVKAANTKGVNHLSCIAHAIHLVVAGALIKLKKRSTGQDEPLWTAVIDEERDETVYENEEDDQLNDDDRAMMESLGTLLLMRWIPFWTRLFQPSSGTRWTQFMRLSSAFGR